MTSVSMVGFTHRACVLGVLEQVSVPLAEREALLRRARAAGFPEAVVLSTCSRTEIYAGPSEADPALLLDLLVAPAGGWTPELRAAAEARSGTDAVRHLFRVAAGLDSRVVGEPEIRGQVRAAYRHAYAAGTVAGTLGELFPTALRAGTEVRERTTVVSQTHSLAHRAVAVGLRRCGRAAPQVVVLGSGRMAAAAVSELRRLGHRPVVVARSRAHAGRLVGPAGARPLAALLAEVRGAELLISATAAGHALVTADLVRRARTGGARPLTVVDLSVPRNVEPAVGDLPGVGLVDIEDLAAGGAGGPGATAPVLQAEALVREAVHRYEEHVAARRAGPLIAAMRTRLEEACLGLLVQSPEGASPAELAREAHRMAGRLAHRPTMLARAAAAADDDATLRLLARVFDVPWSPMRTSREGPEPSASYGAVV